MYSPERDHENGPDISGQGKEKQEKLNDASVIWGKDSIYPVVVKLEDSNTVQATTCDGNCKYDYKVSSANASNHNGTSAQTSNHNGTFPQTSSHNVSPRQTSNHNGTRPNTSNHNGLPIHNALSSLPSQKSIASGLMRKQSNVPSSSRVVTLVRAEDGSASESPENYKVIIKVTSQSPANDIDEKTQPKKSIAKASKEKGNQRNDEKNTETPKIRGKLSISSPGKNSKKISTADMDVDIVYEQAYLEKQIQMVRGMYMCPICGKLGAYKSNIKVHLRTHSKEQPFQCSVCGKSFNASNNLKRHQRETHDRQKPFSCDVCKQGFFKKEALTKHSKAQKCNAESTKEPPPTVKCNWDEKGRPQCTFCNKAFKCLSLLKAHMVVHNGSRPFSCSHCQKTFRFQSNLLRHEKIHLEVKPHTCARCGKGYIEPVLLERHILTVHKGVQLPQKKQPRYRCGDCDRCFHSRSVILLHQLSHTGQKPHKCKHCNKEFSLKSNLKRHLVIHEGKKPFPCDLCSAKFRARATLHMHKLRHNGETPFVCDTCGKGFLSKSGLKDHLPVHHRRRDFACSICRQTFLRRSHLRFHTMRHKQSPEIPCVHCDAKFYRKCDLSRHMLRHTNERPFACGECSKSFTRRHYLMEHMNMHTGEHTLPCKLCNMRFQDYYNLTKHVRLNHTPHPVLPSGNTQILVLPSGHQIILDRDDHDLSKDSNQAEGHVWTSSENASLSALVDVASQQHLEESLPQDETGMHSVEQGIVTISDTGTDKTHNLVESEMVSSIDGEPHAVHLVQNSAAQTGVQEHFSPINNTANMVIDSNGRLVTLPKPHFQNHAPQQQTVYQTPDGRMILVNHVSSQVSEGVLKTLTDQGIIPGQVVMVSGANDDVFSSGLQYLESTSDQQIFTSEVVKDEEFSKPESAVDGFMQNDVLEVSVTEHVSTGALEDGISTNVCVVKADDVVNSVSTGALEDDISVHVPVVGADHLVNKSGNAVAVQDDISTHVPVADAHDLVDNSVVSAGALEDDISAHVPVADADDLEHCVNAYVSETGGMKENYKLDDYSLKQVMNDQRESNCLSLSEIQSVGHVDPQNVYVQGSLSTEHTRTY